MHKESRRTFYCLKITTEASKNIQPNTCPNSVPYALEESTGLVPPILLPTRLARTLPWGGCLLALLPTRAKSPAGEGPWDEVRVPGSLHSSPLHMRSLCAAWEKGPVPWAGAPRGEDKEPAPLDPPLPSPPAQGKLSSSSSAISLANSKSCCSRSRRSCGKRGGAGLLRTGRALSLVYTQPDPPRARDGPGFRGAPALPETSPLPFL